MPRITICDSNGETTVYDTPSYLLAIYEGDGQWSTSGEFPLDAGVTVPMMVLHRMLVEEPPESRTKMAAEVLSSLAAVLRESEVRVGEMFAILRKAGGV